MPLTTTTGQNHQLDRIASTSDVKPDESHFESLTLQESRVNLRLYITFPTQ